MAKILILYSTTDGHTREICQRLKQAIEGQGHQVTLRSIDDKPPVELEQFDKIVIGASIRYGRHTKRVYDFIEKNEQFLESKPNAFFSVNVVARKPGKDAPGTNPYLQRFLSQIQWHPKKLAVFAGKIDYRKYRFWDRQMIRIIMWMTKGPTDPKGVFEFTDWEQVESFGHQIGEM